jgi:acyl-CoA synthetase (AMP-forming)/AMP-acid ligase II
LLMYLSLGGLRRGMLFLSSKSSESADEVVQHELFLLPSFILAPLPFFPSFLLPSLPKSTNVTRGEKGEREQFPRFKLTPSLPMTWQATAAFLACARIGAVHSAVFAGFSAESLRDRVKDCDCKVVITTE